MERADAPAPSPTARTAAFQRQFDSDDEFLEDLSRRSFQYFWEQADPATGLVRDRARTDGRPHDPSRRDISSIAATGFGLAGLCVAAERGWVPRDDAMARARTTIIFLRDRMPQVHGWFYHFVNARTGAREWKSELSSIDTALLVAGVLTARRCFDEDTPLVDAAEAVYARVDFPWMLNGHARLLALGWTPESGFLEARWDHYCELMVLYVLAIGSPAHPIPRESWGAWTRPVLEFGGFRYVSHPDPLFVHQFSHAFLDLRDRRDAVAPTVDWWENSQVATRAHKAFCLSLSKEFPGYGENIWGVTASDSRRGYVAWGGPPRHKDIDGTVVPCAAGGSLMLTPDIAVPALRAMYDRFGDRIYGRYGFADAFHPTDGWVDPDVIGIDVGITLLSAENLRTGRVWSWFMANPAVARVADELLPRSVEPTDLPVER